MDYDLAKAYLQLGIFWLEELRYWEKNPEIYVSLVGSAIYPLYTRTFAPFEERIEKIVSRLNGVPYILKQSKTNIKYPVKLWTEIAIETCTRMTFFIQLILRASRPKLSEELYGALEKASENAIESVKSYEKWLKEQILPIAHEKFSISIDQFNKLLQLRRLGLSIQETLHLGEKYLKEYREALRRIANEIKPGASPEEIKELIKSNHPSTFEEVLRYCKKSIEEAKRFIIEKDLATLPPDEELEIVKTPPYLRHLVPFAAYIPPGPFDKDQRGQYLVTPVEDRPELLREHNYASIVNEAVHEGYPGHHLQLVCANRHPSLIRHLTLYGGGIGAEIIEGYAHWIEEYMREVGYKDGPEMRFLRTLDMLWRAARIIIDVKLCTGQMAFNEAVDFLVKEAGMERPSAIAEVKRYTMTPTYQLSYLIGKHLIGQLRKRLKKKMGKAYSDKFFIDTILYSGSVPYFILKQIFEEKSKVALQKRV
jgi:uncharacterized protein (DUF885 family)